MRYSWHAPSHLEQPTADLKMTSFSQEVCCLSSRAACLHASLLPPRPTHLITCSCLHHSALLFPHNEVDYRIRHTLLGPGVWKRGIVHGLLVRACHAGEHMYPRLQTRWCNSDAWRGRQNIGSALYWALFRLHCVQFSPHWLPSDAFQPVHAA